MSTLVGYASKHGATKGIAEAIAAELGRNDVPAHVIDVDGLWGLDGYEAVVLGSAIYAGHWLRPAQQFALAHADQLRHLPVWMFSSGPCGPPEDLVPDGDPVDIAELEEKLAPVEHRDSRVRPRDRCSPESRHLGVAVAEYRDCESRRG